MRHLLDTATLSREDAIRILDVAEDMAETQQREVRKLPTLRGKTVVNLFFEDSTRTRISFEAAAKRLSADVINFAAKGSSVSKGESLQDTAQTLQAMGADAVVIRHGASGAPHTLAGSGWISAGVVNAGDGTHEHPTQALLDAFTIRRRLGGPDRRGGGLDGLRVTIVGDVLHSRVARSNVWLLSTLGAQVTLVAPPTLVPQNTSEWPVQSVLYDLDAAIAAAPDALMMLRIQSERMNAAYFPTEREYSHRWGLSPERLRALPDDSIVMHPGPMNRGLEISAQAADSARSTVLEQVTNGVSVRMAVLYLLLAGSAQRLRRQHDDHELPPRSSTTPGGDPVDILIEDGVITGLGASLSRTGATVIDADGLIALPGLVDLHTHLREPGFEASETILSGSRAAAAGGFTTVFAMPNTSPVADTAGVVEQELALGQAAGYVRVQPIGAVTVGQRGERLAELGAMADSRAHVRVFSDDGSCVWDPLIMRRALEYVKSFDGVVAQHAQDPRLTEGAQMNEGVVSAELGLAGWPAVAEESIIARDVLLAEHVGSRLHVCHLSTAGSVDIIRWAKQRGIAVTAEVTPHHLLLNDELVRGYDARFKVNPPLRRDEDVHAVRQGLADGTIDIVATDHAPHPVESKSCEWQAAAHGMVGLESALRVVHHAVVETGLLDWNDIARVMSAAPASIGRLGDEGRPLAVGVPATLTLYDPEPRGVFDTADLRGQSINSPFLGRELPGSVRWTFRRGVATLANGELVDTPGAPS